MNIKIKKDRAIGDSNPCYIIMDVGANHNGNLETAIDLIKFAAENGADAIKFQTYTAEGLYSKMTPKFSKDPTTPFEMIQKYQHPREWLTTLIETANKHQIDFSSSPFDYEAVDLLDRLNVPFYKIASPEIVNLDLIEYVAKKQKPVILSTGMATIEEIQDAIDVILKSNNEKIILLHCNVMYPSPAEIVNLRAMERTISIG